MRIISLTLSIFSIAILLLGCDKDDANVTKGTYKGTFTVTYSSGTQTGSITLKLNNGEYSCSSNSNRIPAGGSGSYSFDNDEITFSDENIWTADFDWNLILNGKYDYTINGRELIIAADKNGVGHYEYRLEKK